MSAGTMPLPAASDVKRVIPNAPVRGWRGWPWVVFAVMTAVSVTAAYLNYRNGYIGDYGDEGSHLLAARRIFDSLTPGTAQIGQYWLPVYHMAEIPFIMINPLYTSGLAGVIPSVLFGIAAALGAYRLGVELVHNRTAGAVASLAVIANPVFLDMTGHILMETALVAAIMWAAVYLVKATRTLAFSDIIIAGMFGALASLTHYGAWVIPLFGAVILWWAGRKAGLVNGQRISHAVTFFMVSGYGPVLWMAWCYYIQGNPLYPFLDRATRTARSGVVVNPPPTGTGDPLLVLGNYIIATLSVVGPIVVLLALTFLVIGVVRGRIIHPAVITLGAAGVAMVTAVITGALIGSPVWGRFLEWRGYTTEADDFGGNLRYALWILPFIAVALAYLAGNVRWRQVTIALLTIASAFTIIPVSGSLPTIQAAQHERAQAEVEIGGKLASVYDGSGLIYTASGNGGDQVIWRSGLPAKTFVTEANPKQFASMKPGLTNAAEWLIVLPSTSLTDNPLTPINKAKKLGYEEVARTQYVSNGITQYYAIMKKGAGA